MSSRKRRYSRDEDQSNQFETISSGSTKKRNDKNVSFENYKHELNRFISPSHSPLVHDTEDFWKFLRKYEAMQKKFKPDAESSDEQRGVATNDTTISKTIKLPTLYRKSYCSNIKLDKNFNESLAKSLKARDISLKSDRIQEFRDTLELYLDFKQKEKFAKLRKLRNEQANLPVARYREEIVKTVTEERVVIIAGDTGCGKSTQVPQYLYSAGFSKIACTQPRRIACISLAKRVAFETLTENRNQVGYQIRFERQRNQDTRITFITEGLLLRQVSGEAGLSQYNIIILDEVHERHLHGDFLLGIMKCLIHQQKDLKLVLMSATINLELFVNYFAKEEAKVIQVPGRLYPIQLLYRPIMSEDIRRKSERFDPSPYIQTMQLIDQKYTNDEKGDLLIFLSGMSEITSVVDAAKEYSRKKKNWIILPLHSSLSIAEQDKVFDYVPEGVRKCIVSTNIAETSVTIDGIRFVIDSGKVKEMSYDPLCKMQRLKEFWISKASAEQRKGRAGRTGPGVCYRLYSEEEYNALETYTTPEIQRVPLDSLLLQMIAMGLPDARKFPFIEPPPGDSIENSIISLKEHGALTDNEKLTSIGKTLARLPVDIAIGKMLIMGSLFHHVESVLSLAAALSIQTPFTNRAYRDAECENSRKKLESDHGDPITLLNAYREWLEVKGQSSQEARGPSKSNSRTWCRRRGLEEQRFYEMTKLRAQFKDLLHDCGLLKNVGADSKMPSSSAERAIRHGELKLLKAMKRTYRQSEPRKRKELKVDFFDLGTSEQDAEASDKPGEIDIKDVEFRMRNDPSQVQNLLTASTACNYKDLTMLKLIVCSGLYPQFACADEFNYCKSVNEQLFHTKAKPYVALHPISFFGNHPDILQLEEPDVVSIPGFKSKTAVSSKHQLLAYLSLLETTKPYLVNTMRMPAAQTLLLFAQEIDTNATCSTLVCDSWIALDFPTPDAGLILLSKASNIRHKWNSLLNDRLQASSENDTQTPKKDMARMERELHQELIEFLHTNVPYVIRRLLPADLKTLYVGNGHNDVTVEPNPFQNDFQCESHSTKGGVRVSENITYCCLVESEWSDKMAVDMLETEWRCNRCNLEAMISSIEKLQHQLMCKERIVENEINATIISPSSTVGKANARSYDCPDCKKIISLTPIEILKHKRQHLKEKTEEVVST
ncbi:probable ATP-dependent RNA helicase DHX34 isoform X2 [Cephus cinctus]|uniref:Probable ATP-dependent RNA helicase DHX34 isoform X2 n=1 Tax=Cephus cinctus TaxID=211228 RepID=A0AAJ7BWW6_CEPCN|nr:probable ATP-dependent RNA helicase DHX34 isoform X2 [Cephus cinctus]